MNQKKLCDYGCGREAKYPPKKGMTKWCCEKNWQSCPKSKEENSKILKKICNQPEEKIKRSKLRKKEWKNLEIREKRTKAIKESWSQSDIKANQSKIQKEIQNRLDVKENSSKTALKIWKNPEYRKNRIIEKTLTIEQWQEKYSTFAKEEEMRYDLDGKIQVHCHNHNCTNSKEKEGWFTPNRNQFFNRIYALEKEDGNEGCYFYCSEGCKQICPSYNKKINKLIKEDEIRAGIIKEESSTGELQIFKEEVLKRQREELGYNECEYCRNIKLQELVVHHEYPRKTHPQFELDPDNGVICCGLNSENKCHIKHGHRKRTPCSTGNLANKIC